MSPLTSERLFSRTVPRVSVEPHYLAKGIKLVLSKRAFDGPRRRRGTSDVTRHTRQDLRDVCQSAKCGLGSRKVRQSGA